ncbi:MAG: B-box zinc finger protein [Nanoarchaeota archaeon]
MRIEKACMSCESNIAIFSCKNCGSLVCGNCYDNSKGLCNKCRIKIKG